jgi:hypothetical protein
MSAAVIPMPLPSAQQLCAQLTAARQRRAELVATTDRLTDTISLLRAQLADAEKRAGNEHSPVGSRLVAQRCLDSPHMHAIDTHDAQR